jgi:poly-beta-1,6-N-acetyl-D-glucosamine biosynthesis protein PgaD
MEESGQRAAYPEVINEKGLKTWKRVFIETSITLGFWGIILYLLAVFTTFALWYLGFHLGYYEFYVAGFFEMQRLFSSALKVSSVVMTLSLLWSYYNVLLIKLKGERRGNQVSISFDKDMAKLFHIDPGVLEKIKNCPAISITFNQDDIFLKEIDLRASKSQ